MSQWAAVAFILVWWSSFVCGLATTVSPKLAAPKPENAFSERSLSTGSSGVGFPQKHKREKFLAKTLFMGQLPFTTTKEQLHLFFARRDINDVTIRMLTDKKTKSFRGMAFVDFQSEKDAQAALKMDHGLLAGRRIRIERTAAGGGNKPKRKARILRAKQEQDVEKRKNIVAMIDRVFTRQDARAAQQENAGALLDDPNMHASRRIQVQAIAKSPSSGVEWFRREDVDNQLIDALCTLPDKIARKALKICSRLEVGQVRNRGAYAIGVIKKRLRKAERRGRRKRAAARARKEATGDEDADEDDGVSDDVADDESSEPDSEASG